MGSTRKKWRSVAVKMTAAILLALMLVQMGAIVFDFPLIQPTVEASGEGWLDGWSYRREINITSNSYDMMEFVLYPNDTGEATYSLTTMTVGQKMVKPVRLNGSNYLFVSNGWASTADNIDVYTVNEEWTTRTLTNSSSWTADDFYAFTFPEVSNDTVYLCGQKSSPTNAFVGTYNVTSEEFNYTDNSSAGYITKIMYDPNSDLFYFIAVNGDWENHFLSCAPEDLLNETAWTLHDMPEWADQAENRADYFSEDGCIYLTQSNSHYKFLLYRWNMTANDFTLLMNYTTDGTLISGGSLGTYVTSYDGQLTCAVPFSSPSPHWAYFWSEDGVDWTNICNMSFAGTPASNEELHGYGYTIDDYVFCFSLLDGNANGACGLYYNNGTSIANFTGIDSHYTDTKPIMDGGLLIAGGEGGVLGAYGDVYILYNDHYGNIINLNGHANADYSDVRFTGDDGSTEIGYRILESSVDQANVWVDQGEYTTIYLYYGNAEATTTSNSTLSPYLIYDDFEDNSFNEDVWEKVLTASATVTETGGKLVLHPAGDRGRPGVRSELAINTTETPIEIYVNFSLGTQQLISVMVDWDGVYDTYVRWYVVYNGYDAEPCIPNGDYRLYEYNSATPTKKAESADITLSTYWHVVELSMDAGVLSSTLNGSYPLSTTDLTFTNGTVGLVGREAGSGIGDVSVELYYVLPSRTDIYVDAVGSEEEAEAEDITAPTFGIGSSNETTVSLPCNFSIVIYDDAAPAYVTLEHNITGALTNETWVTVPSNGSTVSFTVDLNDTADLYIEFKFFANDTSGNVGASSSYSLTTTGDSNTLSVPPFTLTSAGSLSGGSWDSVTLTLIFTCGGTAVNITNTGGYGYPATLGFYGDSGTSTMEAGTLILTGLTPGEQSLCWMWSSGMRFNINSTGTVNGVTYADTTGVLTINGSGNFTITSGNGFPSGDFFVTVNGSTWDDWDWDGATIWVYDVPEGSVVVIDFNIPGEGSDNGGVITPPPPTDTDHDGTPDSQDTDDDGDGIPDIIDPHPLVPDTQQPAQNETEPTFINPEVQEQFNEFANNTFTFVPEPARPAVAGVTIIGMPLLLVWLLIFLLGAAGKKGKRNGRSA